MSAERSNGNGVEPNTKRPKQSLIAATAFGLIAFASRAAVANAAKIAADTTNVLPALALPTISKLALVCLLPTLLGYYKSEYGVSYGYGTAIAASSYLVLSSVADASGLPLLPGIGEFLSVATFRPAGIATSVCTTVRNLRSLLPASLPAFHAFSLLFYGTRLDLFLLYRETFLARFRAMRERIEESAKKKGGRLKRTPFLISCAFLYLCMICPLLITGRLCEGMGMSLCAAGRASSILEQSLRVSVIMTLAGFLLGAFGDLNKTIGKLLRGEDALVTGGIFRFFRHPNYTGEVIGWSFNCLAGFLAVAWKAMNGGVGDGGRLALCKSMAPYLVLSVLGATGISFVLATATTGLEFRQKEKYGDTDEYQKWIKKSWAGFQMGPAAQNEDKIDDDEGGESKSEN